MAFPLLIRSDIIPFCAATRRNRNLVADDCAAVALERIQPDSSDGSPKRPFPLHQVSTGSALPTAPSGRTGVPVKHAQGLHSSSEDDDEPPQLVSGGFEGGDTMASSAWSARAQPQQGLLLFAGRTCRVWAGVKQPVTGHLVQIRQLR
jgi:hypothetical protein